MAELVTLKCPNCGAQLPPRSTLPGLGGASVVTCEYCKHTFEVAQPAPPPPPVAPFAPPAVRVYVTPSYRQPRWIGLAVIIPILFAVGINVFIQTRVSSSISSAVSNAAGAAGVTSTTDDGGRMLWDSTEGPPVPASVAGREAFIGRYRLSDQGDALVIGAFDATTLKRIWKTAPLGSYSDGHDSTRWVVAGNRVLVSDFRAQLHLEDLGSGAEAAVVKLSDRVDEMCSSPDGHPQAWVHTKDNKGVMVDAGTGASKTAARPPWCPASPGFSSHGCRGVLAEGLPHATCLPPEKAPKVAGFETGHVLAEGTTAVAVGKKSPGTAIPEAVGFEVGGKSAKWQHPIPSGDLAKVGDSDIGLDDLVNGRYIVPYEATSDDWHMSSFDARTGERQWDITLPKVFAIARPETLSVSSTRIFLARTSSLEVFDVKNGALVGTIGTD